MQIFWAALNLKRLFSHSSANGEPKAGKRDDICIAFKRCLNHLDIFLSTQFPHFSKKDEETSKKGKQGCYWSPWPLDIIGRWESKKTASELHNLQFIFKCELQAKVCPAWNSLLLWILSFINQQICKANCKSLGTSLHSFGKGTNSCYT